MLPFSKNQQVAYRYLNGKAIALPYGDEPLRRTINTNFTPLCSDTYTPQKTGDAMRPRSGIWENQLIFSIQLYRSGSVPRWMPVSLL